MCSSGLVQAPSQLLMGGLQGSTRQGESKAWFVAESSFLFSFPCLGSLEAAGAQGTAWDWLSEHWHDCAQGKLIIQGYKPAELLYARCFPSGNGCKETNTCFLCSFLFYYY